MNDEKTVLIADDDHDLISVLKTRCQDFGLRVITVNDALTALETITQTRPDLVVLDINMPAGNGLSVCEMMSTDARFSKTPVIILTGQTDHETVKRCHEMCAYYVLKGPDVWERVEHIFEEHFDVVRESAVAGLSASAVRSDALGSKTFEVPFLTSSAEADGSTFEEATDSVAKDEGPIVGGLDVSDRRRQADSVQMVDQIFEMLGSSEDYLEGITEPHSSARINYKERSPWVLHIDDDPEISQALKIRLEAKGVAVVHAYDGREGYRTAFTHTADAIILDMEMPNGQGDYVLRRLKENPATQKIPVIMLTGRKDRSLERQILNMGAERFLTKPVEFQVLFEELSRHITVLD